MFWFRQKIEFRRKQIYSPLVYSWFVLFSMFPVHRNFVISETNDRSYSLVLATTGCSPRGLLGSLGGEVRSDLLHWLLKAS